MTTGLGGTYQAVVLDNGGDSDHPVWTGVQ
jgi:hypothetical protein